MSNTLQDEQDQAILTVNGDFQGKNAADIRDQLMECLDSGHHTIVVDLAAATAINATGLGVLVNAQQRLESLGGKLMLRGVSHALREAFIRTRLYRSFVMKEECET